MTVVLDSWAVLAYLHERMPASALVADLLEHEQPVMSWINLGEVFYVLCRATDENRARTAVRDLRDVLSAELPDETLVLRAAGLKAARPMAYAHGFAAATALHHDAELWTGDPELLVRGAEWRWRDLREPAAS
jgi:predicted nucleic acid-binding protein